jgi:hypothetical protein
MDVQPMELEEQFFETSRARLRRTWPFLHQFRAFRIAFDARKIVLGAAAAVLLAAGYRLIDHAPFAPAADPLVLQIAHPWPWHESPSSALAAPDQLRLLAWKPWSQLWDAALSGPVILRPVLGFLEHGRRIFQRGNSWPDAADAWTRLLWTLAVWSLLGTALSRMAAVQFARQTTPGLRESLRYALRQFPSAFGAPLLPLVFLGLFWLVCVLIGLIGRIPGIGEPLAGIFWFVPLILGLAMAAILIFIAAGWPLMICTGGVEGTDAFDGLSRAYDYLLARPWYALGLTLLTLVYGSLLVFFVAAVTGTGAYVAEWATAGGMGEERVTDITGDTPASMRPGVVIPMTDSASTIGAAAAGFWMRVLAVLLWGFVYSFFWTAATVIYFLLRRSVDAEPLDKVYLEPTPGAGEKLPLVGMAAAEKREGEAPSPVATEDGT